MEELFILPGEGMPIQSVRVRVALLHHHERARDTNFALAAFVVVTALVHPIYWSLFFVVGVIGLAHLTNVEDRLRWWIVIWIVAWISVLWKFSWETCFLTKFASSGLPLFSSFWLIVSWCIVLLHRSA
jgi:hypothetical protein